MNTQAGIVPPPFTLSLGAAVAYKDIGSYGAIGNMHAAALVGLDGSIDWCCMPRIDSPSVFAAILDEAKGGSFRIAPLGLYESSQRYLPETNILETTFTTPTGTATVTDFMPLGIVRGADHLPQDLHRIVECTEGSVPMQAVYRPRFDYARAFTHLELMPHGVQASSGPHEMALSVNVPITLNADAAESRFTLEPGRRAVFVVSYGRSEPMIVGQGRSAQRLEHTAQAWRGMVEELHYDGLWRDQVVRSFLALHLLIYAPTGAIAAALTTSLPEHIGGVRNWDYRFCWLRDSAFTLGVLYRLGDLHDALHFLNWLLAKCARFRDEDLLQVLYGLNDDSGIPEEELGHLEGYQGSRPVRIGNGAAFQLQLDIFGEVLLSINTYRRYGGYISAEIWSIVNAFAEIACRRWREPDRSIWEVRGRERHFTYSKAMCWAALDNAITIGEATGHQGDFERWRAEADAIKADVLAHGWNEKRQAFVQSYGSDALDASSLILPWTNILPPDDPRILSTIERTVEELGRGPFVNRYNVDEADDGLQGEEGALTMLSFWLIGSLLGYGKVQQAKDLFEEMLGYSNHLGLYSEMIDPVTKQALGNFPQAFSHIGLIHTARNLSAALQENPRSP